MDWSGEKDMQEVIILVLNAIEKIKMSESETHKLTLTLKRLNWI